MIALNQLFGDRFVVVEVRPDRIFQHWHEPFAA
jgi:hypothetical protein